MTHDDTPPRKSSEHASEPSAEPTTDGGPPRQTMASVDHTGPATDEPFGATGAFRRGGRRWERMADD